MSVLLRDTVRQAINKSFSEQVEGLAGSVWAKIAGGDSVDDAFKSFDASLLLNLTVVHKRMLAEAEAVMKQAGIPTDGN